MPFTPRILSRVAGLAVPALKGGGRRTLLGATVGGIAGGAMSDSNTGTGTFESVVRGAGLGALVGAASSKSLWTKIAGKATGVSAGQTAAKAARAAGRGSVASAAIGVGAAVEKNASRAYGLAKKATGLAGWGLAQANKVGGWTLKHPTSALLLGGGVAAGLYGMKTGPGRAQLSVEEMGQLAYQQGLSSSGFSGGQVSSHQYFMNSTNGLVQGLHHGRH